MTPISSEELIYPNLGQSIDAGNEVDTAVLELKSSRLAIALVMVNTSVLTGSILPTCSGSSVRT